MGKEQNKEHKGTKIINEGYQPSSKPTDPKPPQGSGVPQKPPKEK